MARPVTYGDKVKELTETNKKATRTVVVKTEKELSKTMKEVKTAIRTLGKEGIKVSGVTVWYWPWVMTTVRSEKLKERSLKV